MPIAGDVYRPPPDAPLPVRVFVHVDDQTELRGEWTLPSPPPFALPRDPTWFVEPAVGAQGLSGPQWLTLRHAVAAGRVVGVSLRGVDGVDDRALARLGPLDPLYTLDLTDSDVTDAGLRWTDAARLKALYLDGTAVRGQVLDGVVGATALEVLSLSRTAVGDDTLAQVAGLTQLIELHLSGTRVTDAGVVALRTLTALRVLDLSDNHLDGSSLAQLTVLPLRALYLGNTGTNDAALRSLAALTQLETLDLPATAITDAGGPALCVLPLHALVAFRTGVGDGTIKACVDHWTQLRVLDLSQTHLTDAGLRLIGKLVTLRELDVGYTNVSDKGVAALSTLTALTGVGLSAHAPFQSRPDRAGADDGARDARRVGHARSTTPVCRSSPRTPSSAPWRWPRRG